MEDLKKRLDHEIAHGEKMGTDAEAIWNWTSGAGKVRAERRAKYLIDLGKFSSTDRVLEIGCGTAIFTEKVYQATHAKITAIDISEILLAQARLKLPNVEFKTGDAMNMSFDDESFEGVFGSSVIHHLDIEKSLREIFRVLKTGSGRMIFAEPNMLNPQIFVQKNVPAIKEWLGDSPDETAVVRWKLAQQMKEIGFKNIKIFPYDFLHPSVPEFLIGTVRGIGKIIEQIPLLREIAGSVIIYGEK